MEKEFKIKQDELSGLWVIWLQNRVCKSCMSEEEANKWCKDYVRCPEEINWKVSESIPPIHLIEEAIELCGGNKTQIIRDWAKEGKVEIIDTPSPEEDNDVIE